MHHRILPRPHRFRYGAHFYGFDVDEVERLPDHLSWFGYNRWRPVSLYSQDYLDGQTGGLRQKLEHWLARHGQHPRYATIMLVTGARCLGHVFNPVSFWCCYNDQQHLQLVIAEVNNTFGERHAYVLDKPLPCVPPFVARYRVEKAFYVSPYNAVEGDYEFRLADPTQGLDIRLRVFHGSQPVINTWMRGAAVPLDQAGWGSWMPWSSWLTLARIHWEAAILYFKKKLPIVYKPRPGHIHTLKADPPTALHRAAIAAVEKFLARASQSHLVMDLPDGRMWHWGCPEQPVAAEMRILNWDFFLRLIWDGDVALGDGLVAGEWESPDLTAVVRFFIDNRERLDDRRLWYTRWLGRAQGWLRQLRRANTLGGSKRNIQAHYDLGNELYRRFLDPTMSYSCAIFESPEADLESAQRAKIRHLLDKARLDAECHVLEIGCGWGSLAIEAVRRSGCRVTGLTLSEQQLEWARARVAEAGLQDRIDIRLCDYRLLEGRYDRILSCEMLEAVGHENFPDYFRALERMLSPNGLVVLQVITVPDFSYHDYRRSQDWIQKEIFPGALCPSLTALLEAARKHSQLVLEHLENIGPHYARTLREWRQRFLASWPELRLLGYDERFRRAWCYYLSYCEAAFASRNLGDVQMVLTRPKNERLCAEDPAWLR